VSELDVSHSAEAEMMSVGVNQQLPGLESLLPQSQATARKNWLHLQTVVRKMLNRFSLGFRLMRSFFTMHLQDVTRREALASPMVADAELP